MKYKCLTVATICFSLIFLLTQIPSTGNAADQTQLEFNIIPSKSSYEIGEVKMFSFEIANRSDDSVYLLRFSKNVCSAMI
jgi:hypothetical protein